MENKDEILQELEQMGITVINNDYNEILVQLFNRLPDIIEKEIFMEYYKLFELALKYGLECTEQLAIILYQKDTLKCDIDVDLIQDCLEAFIRSNNHSKQK